MGILTPQREAILDAICEGQGHSSLGSIFFRARQKDESIDKSTLYRALELFQELGIVLAADVEGHERGYEIAKPMPHHHMICQSCKREFDIDSPLVDAFYKKLNAEYGYKVTMDHLVLNGVCPDCQD